MTRRYYHPDLPPTGGLIQLNDEEAQHAIRVMRVQAGDIITLFDGRGHEAEAEILSINRRDCHCRSEPADAVDRESSIKLHLGIALPKPERAKELIERLTELGVHTVTPLISGRTQRAPSSTLLEKLRRAVIESCKQCGRNQLMTILDPQSFLDLIADDHATESRWIAHPTGNPWRSLSKNCETSRTVLVGPEGGWSEDEVESAVARSYQPVSLGKRILRIETAAAHIAANTVD